MNLKPTTGRRKLWLAILGIAFLSAAAGAQSGSAMLGSAVGMSLFYIVPVGTWEWWKGRGDDE